MSRAWGPGGRFWEAIPGATASIWEVELRGGGWAQEEQRWAQEEQSKKGRFGTLERIGIRLLGDEKRRGCLSVLRVTRNRRF